ncbi:hypothetical protein SKAU_G00396260 [Synaphobranchus kaupii]|uniref:P-type ATPase N-terminal domain-containing protein n=1 Tax=Synaphobranchus kaupii TaxID=118154 RepID=A0A9Q1IC30_SYNKA|nr:hypothetical protein SKAU_G00396260 [Synaphobranchus kaupii]
MERLRLQWRRLLSSESGRGWYTPPAAIPPKSTSGPPDPLAHKVPGKRRSVIARHGPYHSEYYAISKGYQGNSIRTTKYTLINFIPMNLFEQFHRAANLYFLFLVVLNWVPVVEAFQKEITMIPLVVVLTVIAFKDALEDYRRYRFDRKINNLIAKVYSGKQQRYVEQSWKDVHVGDFVRLSCNEIIPADMVLLHSSEPEGVCHIETSNLDGETNLKQRQVVRGLTEQGIEVTPERFTSRIECEGPNNDLNRFRGFIKRREDCSVSTVWPEATSQGYRCGHRCPRPVEGGAIITVESPLLETVVQTQILYSNPDVAGPLDSQAPLSASKASRKTALLHSKLTCPPRVLQYLCTTTRLPNPLAHVLYT